MKVSERLRRMSLRQLLNLTFLFLRNPLLAFPAYTATVQTFRICNKHFGKLHHGNGIENAYRHALWNALICKNSSKFIKNDQKLAEWTQKLTDLYEKITKNDPLDKAMDLHNNAIGRKLYLEQKSSNLEESLMKMTENGVKITKIESISDFPNRLVYIS